MKEKKHSSNCQLGWSWWGRRTAVGGSMSTIVASMLSQMWSLICFPILMIHWTGFPAPHGSAHYTCTWRLLAGATCSRGQREDGIYSRNGVGIWFWQFWVMSFGVCSAPATFKWLMEHVMAGLLAVHRVSGWPVSAPVMSLVRLMRPCPTEVQAASYLLKELLARYWELCWLTLDGWVAMWHSMPEPKSWGGLCICGVCLFCIAFPTQSSFLCFCLFHSYNCLLLLLLLFQGLLLLLGVGEFVALFTCVCVCVCLPSLRFPVFDMTSLLIFPIQLKEL